MEFFERPAPVLFTDYNKKSQQNLLQLTVAYLSSSTVVVGLAKCGV